MGSLFSPGRVLLGDRVIFEGEIWVEETAVRGRPAPWKAGFFSPTSVPQYAGDCRLELNNGRSGIMTCTKSQPGMTGGSNLQFTGVGPLVGVGEKPPESLPERLEVRVTRPEREQYERAAERAGLALPDWMRDRLTKGAKHELEP